MPTINDLIATRAVLVDAIVGLAALPRLDAVQTKAYDDQTAEVAAIDAQITRMKAAEALMASAAKPVGGGGTTASGKAAAAPKTDPYERDPSIVVGGMLKMVAMAKGSVHNACDYALGIYGEDHPVTKAMLEAKALNTLTGSAGGFVVPPDFVDLIIPLLYAQTVVRRAGALTMPMPNGTMTIPKMTGGSAAYWIGETKSIPDSAPSFGQVVATAHKLAALVPVSNDQMRYAMAQFDAMLRNDIVKQMALAEDAAFIRGAGTQYSPRGLRSFVLPAELLASTAAYTPTTVNQELAGLVTKLEMANLPLSKVGWLMSPRTKNYLLNLQNTNGFYTYKEEMTEQKTLLGYPYYATTQIPVNLTVDANGDCSELYLVDFGECLILESRQMEFAISTEGTYTDANGVLQSAFQNDLTLIRAIMAEDFQLRHDEAVAMAVGLRWAPAVM